MEDKKMDDKKIIETIDEDRKDDKKIIETIDEDRKDDMWCKGRSVIDSSDDEYLTKINDWVDTTLELKEFINGAIWSILELKHGNTDIVRTLFKQYELK